MSSIQGVAVECDVMQKAVLMSRAEYKKQTHGISAVKFHLIPPFYFITLYRPDTTINVSCKSYNLLVVSYMFRLLTAIIRLIQKDDAI